MMVPTSSTAQAQLLTERPAWKAFAEHYQTMRNLHLRRRFAGEPRRGENFTAEAALRADGAGGYGCVAGGSVKR